MKIVVILIIGLLWINKMDAQIQNDTTQIVDYHVHIFSPELITNLSIQVHDFKKARFQICLLYTSPSPRDATLSRMPSSA